MEVIAEGVRGEPLMQPRGSPAGNVPAVSSEDFSAREAAEQVHGPSGVVVREPGSGPPAPDATGEPLSGLVACRAAGQVGAFVGGSSHVTAEAVVPQAVLAQGRPVGARDAE